MIKITLLANAGLLLEAPGARLLVDALFSLPAPGFSAPSGQMSVQQRHFTQSPG